MENKELKEKFVDERTGIEYRLVGDYYIPNITIPKARRTGNIGKYGRLKLNYMKKYKIPEYTEMLLSNELKSYLLDIEDKCKERLEVLIKQMAEKENVNEELKANNQLFHYRFPMLIYFDIHLQVIAFLPLDLIKNHILL